MPAEIRPARASDLQQLVALEGSAFVADRISRASFRQMMSAPSASVLVAEEGDGFAGYAALLFRANSRKARLYSLAAAPGHRGIGHSLLVASEATATARCCNELRLEVRADNARAIALYERTGYRLFGQKPAYYADGATALRFRKPLSAAEAGMPTP